MAIFRSGACALVALFLAAAPAAAQAAPPQYQSSNPDRGATVHQPPDRVEVTFDQPLDETSTLVVTDECDRRVDNESTEVDGNSMSIGIVEKPAGEYHVEYSARGLAGITGTGTGHFTFTVHAGKGCKGGDHNHHGNGNNGKKNHENGHGGNGGDDHGDDATHHSGGGMTDHGTTHGSGTGTHSGGHGNAGTHAGDGHNAGNDHSDHNGNGGGVAAGADVPGITSSDTARTLFTRADSNALLASLGLCLMLGILGGTVLRASAARR